MAHLGRLWAGVGQRVRDARLARKWTLVELARRAGVSRTIAYSVESGVPTSLEALARLSAALGLRLELALLDPRRRSDARRELSVDSVHSAMGEFEARQLRQHGYSMGLDEPYQHYQFAGRADLVAWDVSARALLHIENRTRFPDFQQMAGAFNAKRAYLAAALADRLDVFGWRSETHVIVALWSSEVLHALRLRAESFRTLCPDPPAAFDGWWNGLPPAIGTTSTLVVLDPSASPRQRAWLGLETALGAALRARHRGYADAAAKLR